MIETPKRLLPIEVKAAARVMPVDTMGLEAFLDEYAGSADGGLLLYGGAEDRRMLCDEIVYFSSCSFSIPSFIPFISSWKPDQVQRFLNS